MAVEVGFTADIGLAAPSVPPATAMPLHRPDAPAASSAPTSQERSDGQCTGSRAGVVAMPARNTSGLAAGEHGVLVAAEARGSPVGTAVH